MVNAINEKELTCMQGIWLQITSTNQGDTLERSGLTKKMGTENMMVREGLTMKRMILLERGDAPYSSNPTYTTF